MRTKREAVNISVPGNLLERFDAMVGQYDAKRSWVLQECMKAYIDLGERCLKTEKKRLPTLEFKGCENEDQTHSPADQNPSFKKLADARIFFPTKRELKKVK